MPLSVVIVAQDEERTIGRVLSAVKSIAGEVILVDSGSSDRTMEIAREHGAKCFHQEWLGYAGQKNYAMSLASFDWILSLDADEIVTEELASEIDNLLADSGCTNFCGYTIPRVLYIGDTPVRHGGFYPDAQLRLIQKGAGKFNDRMVHEAIKVEGPTRELSHCLLHYAYKDVADYQRTLEKYARLSAAEFKRQKRFGWRCHPANELFHPYWTFLWRYLVRGGWSDGLLGLELARIYSDYVRKKIRYLRELKEAQD